MRYYFLALAADPLSNTRLREAGVAAWWSEDYTTADELFHKIETLHPTGAWPGDIIATRLKQGRYEEAVELTERILANANRSDAANQYMYNFVKAFSFPYVGRYAEAAEGS